MPHSPVPTVQIDECIAFKVYNLAPPTLRRGISMLGLLHKRVLGLAHPAYSALFPFATQHAGAPHTKQLVSHALEITHCHRLFERSLFGAVGIYNHLPQIVVDLEDVSKFQSALTNIARWRCNNGVDDWKYSFSAGHPGAYVGTVYG